MTLTCDELKELWSKSDEYFQFSFYEYKSFGSRLKKIRELNNLTQRDVALSLYNARKSLQLPISTTDSLIKMFGKWECNTTDFSTVFSMDNLRILKRLFNVDYDFLFCECDTPHRYSADISKETGLSIKSVEKLSAMNKEYDGVNTSGDACYSYALLSSLDALISDDDLLCYLSYFLTNLFYEEDSDDEEFNTISILKPANGSVDEDSILDGESIILDVQKQLSVFTTTIATKLCKLRESINISTSDIPVIKKSPLGQDMMCDSFGNRLRFFRRIKGLTQSDIADLLADYRKQHNIPTSDKKSILRTYQNWERKNDSVKEVRISLQDLKMLQSCLNCSFDYLLGDTNEINSLPSPIHVLGLSEDTYVKLSKYTKSMFIFDESVPAYASRIIAALDLIISDNDLLSNLTYFLSDLPFYTRLNFCSVLKPISFELNSPADLAYDGELFNDKEMRNVFLPEICNRLLSLRKKNHNNMLV